MNERPASFGLAALGFMLLLASLNLLGIMALLLPGSDSDPGAVSVGLAGFSAAAIAGLVMLRRGVARAGRGWRTLAGLLLLVALWTGAALLVMKVLMV